MQSITTKYLSATNTRGARIKATTTAWGGRSATIPYPYWLSGADVYFEAVKALNAKHDLGWDISDMSYGGTKDGYVFVFTASKI